jgi:hypothetical protein
MPQIKKPELRFPIKLTLAQRKSVADVSDARLRRNRTPLE